MESKTGLVFQFILFFAVVFGIAYYKTNTEKVHGWFKDSHIEIVDNETKRKNEEDNTLGESEALKAILNQYTYGTVVKGYTLGQATDYKQISNYTSNSTRNTRKFLVGYNLSNGRIGYLEGAVTKKDGVIKVSVDKIILE